MKKYILMLAVLCVCLTGCMQAQTQSSTQTQAAKLPTIPKQMKIGKDGIPMLTVYDVADDTRTTMSVEDYVMGVVAGEMKNDWETEALKAQAILARTYVMKFVQDKTSQYENADISTDVKEAQAYNAQDVNARVRSAVGETAGQVLSVDGEYPYAWFHAHAGGMTELPSVALDYEGEVAYLQPVESPDSDEAPDYAKQWTAEFTKEQVAQACREAGAEIRNVNTIAVGEKGESGRAKTILVNDTPVSAPEFRIQIGANALRSTLIDDISTAGDTVTFSGRGFGHGVGMSQWGAYAMAKEGKTAEEILNHYFRNTEIVTLWKAKPSEA